MEPVTVSTSKTSVCAYEWSVAEPTWPRWRGHTRPGLPGKAPPAVPAECDRSRLATGGAGSRAAFQLGLSSSGISALCAALARTPDLVQPDLNITGLEPIQTLLPEAGSQVAPGHVVVGSPRRRGQVGLDDLI